MISRTTLSLFYSEQMKTSSIPYPNRAGLPTTGCNAPLKEEAARKQHHDQQSCAASFRLLRICCNLILPALIFFHSTNVPVAVAIQTSRQRSATERSSPRPSAQDEAFLEDLSRRSFQYFLEHSNPQTGLTLDRARADGSPYPADTSNHNVASIASTGFGLTALCIAAERGWVMRDEARRRVVTTLDFFANRATNERGWFYHFVDAETGERRWRSEISSIDTALLLGGVLTARQCFARDPEVVRLADFIYRRVDFVWMLNGHPSILAHGWKPETGFLKARWGTYDEHLILQLLAIGSPTHPISPRSWRGWAQTRITYKEFTFIAPSSSPQSGNPLFVHQFSHAWVDFRGRREDWYPFTNYFENSVAATRAQQAFSANELAREFPASYGENLWGITASDSAKGYIAWGAPPRDPQIDGTLVPCAPAGSLMFTPDISLATLRTMHERFGERIYKRYGFVDAFNPTTNWVNADVIGIDLGVTLLSAENLRTGNVWRWFMRNPEIPRAMDAVGLRQTSKGAKGNRQKLRPIAA